MREIDEGLMYRVLEFIGLFQAERGYSPGQLEIVKRFNITAPRAFRFVHALEGRGMIELNDDGTIVMPEHLKRYPKCHAPVIGTVNCGTPTEAIADYKGVMELPCEFTGDSKCFILRAKGDSMIDAGIEEGDYLVIREQNYADINDIVVAIRGEFSDEADATLKRYKWKDGRYVLHAENNSGRYKDMDAGEFRIVGKLVSLIRKKDSGGDEE